MQIQELNNKTEIDKTFKVMSQIYNSLDEKSYTEEVLIMIQNGYKMAAIFEDKDVDEGRCIGVVGVKVARKMQYKRVLEVEDFMICRQKR